MKIWTDDECIEVDPNDVGELEAAMLFKAEHIKAKADPEMFSAVSDMLSRLWDTATKRVDVVRCRECKKKNKKKCPMTIVNFGRDGKEILVQNHVPDDFYCAAGERKEGADNG